MTTIEVFKKYESSLTRLEEKNPDQFGVFLHGISEPFSTSISSFNIEGEIPMVICKKASQMLLLTDVGIHWIISEKEEFRSWNSIAEILISNQQVIIRKKYNGILVGNGSFSTSLISDSFVWNLMFKELLVAKVMSKPVKKAINPSDFVINTESTNKNRNAITMSSNLTVDVKKNQTGSNRTTKEQIESEYKWLITILSDAAKAISDINGKNEQFDKLQGSLVMIVEERVLDAQIEMENSLNSIPWDNLVIAFFGETNAGKSTIIETFRILFDSKRNKNQDGKIVGDGRQDFTKEYYEYRLSIKGRPFTLIDVPGIEGDEKEFKDIIKGALRKAHCVFYVQGHNKKPDSATASKIKNYLGDWVNVYSIQNVRGAVTDYDEEEERETLLTPNVIKNEKLITDSFKEILSDVYKGNVPIQALLAMCSKATFAPERVDLQKTQDKLLKYFQSSDEVLRFSQFQTLINIVAEKANNFTLEIAEANRQKMISIANKVLESIRQEVDTNEQEFDKFEKQLRQYRRDVLTDCTDAINSIRYDVTALIERRYNSLKNTIYGIIDSNASNDDKKASIQSEASKVCGSLSREISAKCNSVINNLKIKNEQHKKQLNAFDFGKINIFLSGAYPQIDGEDMGFAVDELKIDIGDVGDFLGAVAGFAGVGAFFGPIGAGVGTCIGLGWHLLKKAFGDGGKGEAKEIVANSLKETCEITKRSAMEDVEKIANDIRSYSIKATRQIDSELQCLGELNRQTDGLRKQITNFDNKIKQVVYGIV